MIQYLAGIFDAEGYVRIRKSERGSYSYECKIYMCNYKIVEQFSIRYNLTIKTALRGVNRKTIYFVTLNKKELLETPFIKDLLPFLNEKREQLQEVLNSLTMVSTKEDAYNKYMLAKKDFTHTLNLPLSYEYIAGIMDGDGWFTMFNANGKLNPSIFNYFFIGLEQRYEPMVRYLLNYGGHITTRKVKDSINHVQTYEWKNGLYSMLEFLINIEPFLIEKKEVCNLFINYITKYVEFNNFSKNIMNSYKELRKD